MGFSGFRVWSMVADHKMVRRGVTAEDEIFLLLRRSTSCPRPMSKPSFAAWAAILLMLTACGGGGSSSSSSTPNQPTPPLPTPTPAPEPVGFTLSGTVTASSNMRIDGDTNNPSSPFFSNDSVQTAQIIPSPVTLGGYVNVAGAGEPGQTQVNGDLDDYFQVELLAGQSITLLVADFDTADADLYLLDTNGASLDFSIEEGEIETLTVSQDGTYIVNVFAFSGATNYILAIGSTPPGITARPKPADSSVILWQAVVKYRSGNPIANSSTALQEHARRFGMTRRAGNRNRAGLMALDGELTALTERQHRHRLGAAWRKRSSWQKPAKKALWETLMAIKSMREDPDVLFAAPNYRLHALATPNDEAYPTQWHYPLINLPAAWDMTTGSPEVIVAVVDTGILSAHPDLAGQLVAGYDFIRDTSSAGDGDGIDPNPEDMGDGGAVGSNSFHGTHVSGTIAAASDNGIGVAGVAWNARIMPLRVLGIDGGTSYDVRQGVLYAAGLKQRQWRTTGQARRYHQPESGWWRFQPSGAGLVQRGAQRRGYRRCCRGQRGQLPFSLPLFLRRRYLGQCRRHSTAQGALFQFWRRH